MSTAPVSAPGLVRSAGKAIPAPASILDLTNPPAYLRGALEAGHFELYCQPLKALKRPGELSMAEIFVRMREEENALLPPGDFIGVFESLGMVPELNGWALRETIRQALERPAMSFALNIGRQSLHEARFLEFVVREIRSSGFAPERLVFEVSAADAGASLVAAQRFAEALRRAGARLLIQDFRCDPASLNLFRLLRASGVKLDGAVVRRLRYSAAARSVVEDALRALASAGAQTIAESVEDEETLALVRRLGVDYAQGFGIVVPAPLHRVLGSAQVDFERTQPS